MKSLQIAVLKTLAYADIFDFPLSSKELFLFIIANKSISNSRFNQALSLIKANHKRIQTNGKYYFLSGRQKIVDIRKNREKWSRLKLKIARRAASWLRLIPWIKMVAVTGSLAMNNSDKNDDIDLLIVCSQGRLWLTRLFAVILTEIFGNRRRPNDKQFEDKICLNIFLDENHLAIPKNEQDLFSAHEVVQLKPIWEKDGIYQKFLAQNRWVKKYLANAIEINRRYQIANSKYENKVFNILNLICKFSFFFLNFNIFENLARNCQIWYMKSRRTTETIQPGRILFHPQDARRWILVEYEKRLEKLKIKD